MLYRPELNGDYHQHPILAHLSSLTNATTFPKNPEKINKFFKLLDKIENSAPDPIENLQAKAKFYSNIVLRILEMDNVNIADDKKWMLPIQIEYGLILCNN